MIKTFSMKRLAFILTTIFFVCFISVIPCFAQNDLDNLGGKGHTTSQNQSSSEDNNAISDYLTGRSPVTSDNMEQANQLAGPIASAIGTLTGVIMIIVSAAIFFITACDLMYIGIPFLRTTLNPNYGMQAQGGAPMGGMGMMGGMRGMGGMQPQQATSGRRVWVSDEAIAAVNLANPAPQQGGSPMMGGGMGMGMGMMGGMGAMQQPQQTMSTKSVIFTYLKKRMFFIIIFTICSVILMSSLLTDCGINLASLLSKIISKFNGTISNVSV